MKKYSLLIFISFIALHVTAQSPGGGPKGRVYGKITDAASNKGIESVSVVLEKKMKNATTGAMKDSVLAGGFTKPNGDFSFDNIPFYDSAKLVITAVGYTSIEQQVDLTPAANADFASPEIDLGNFSVQTEAEVLGNVVVTAKKPTLEMGIDRRIFNVEQSITATGGTAIDVMRNIPSVTVDVEGNVQLRNASPQVFVDGRPTILTLDQIPADNIEKVELITNPSAKFDASSSGGIINVVLKKNRRVGINGNASVAAGTPSILTGNVTLNLREGKFNFFVSGNYNTSGGKVKEETKRQNKKNGMIDSYFNQSSVNKRTREFYSGRFGIDYFIDNRNTISISENLVKGSFSGNEEQQQVNLNSNEELVRTGMRYQNSENKNNRSSTQLNYIHKFNSSGHQLSADVNFNTSNGTNKSLIENYFYNPDGTEYSPVNRVRNDGNSKNTQLTTQIDYANPINEDSKFEAGFRNYTQNNNSVYNAFAQSPNGSETKLPLSNNYKIKESVTALYTAYSGKVASIKYQAGLRGEISKLDGKLIDKEQDFGYTYPNKLKNIWDALFPSLFLTKSLNENEDIQVNYSRRIRRPNFWQLNPFIDINDPLNIRQGNPGLRPEFTNSFEVNYNNNYSSGNFLASLFIRNTQGDITQYSDTITAQQYEQLNNAAIDPNAILSTYINAKSQNRIGVDLTLQQNIGKSIEIIPNVNLQYRKVNADVKSGQVSNEGWNFETKLIVNYKLAAPGSWLFKNINMQLTGEYESPRVIPQGKVKEQYRVDYALRKDMFKDKKGTLTFSINDVFNTNRWGTIYDTDNFYQDGYRRRNPRNFRITFSYRFGDSNFSLFKRDRNGSPGGQEREDFMSPMDNG